MPDGGGDMILLFLALRRGLWGEMGEVGEAIRMGDVGEVGGRS